MGAGASKISELFLKLMSNDIVDKKHLSDLAALIKEREGQVAGLDSTTPIFSHNILCLTYTCTLNAETSTQEGIRGIVLKAAKNNQERRISGELKITDPFSFRCRAGQ